MRRAEPSCRRFQAVRDSFFVRDRECFPLVGAANAVAGRVEVAPRGWLDEAQGRVKGTVRRGLRAVALSAIPRSRSSGKPYMDQVGPLTTHRVDRHRHIPRYSSGQPSGISLASRAA